MKVFMVTLVVMGGLQSTFSWIQNNHVARGMEGKLKDHLSPILGLGQVGVFKYG